MMEVDGKNAVLNKMVETFPNCDYWNDSCAFDDLKYAIERGAKGATTNPISVKNILKKELPIWRDTIENYVKNMSEATEEEIAWALIEKIAQERSKLLLHIYEKFNGKKGRISIQTNPKYYRSVKFMVKQAQEFARLAPNIQVKIPCSNAGIKAMEEATYHGVSINATVCFSVPQAIAVAEAVERGLSQRVKKGLKIDDMAPVCTIMFGRVEDYIRQYCLDYGYMIDPTALNWVAVSIFKKLYHIYIRRGYYTRLLMSGPRHFYHWYQVIGGNYAMTINHAWQKRINESGAIITNTIDNPVEQRIIDELCKVPEFVKAYDENGMDAVDFENYGAFCNTMTSFLEGYTELLQIIRGFMLPNPLK